MTPYVMSWIGGREIWIIFFQKMVVILISWNMKIGGHEYDDYNYEEQMQLSFNCLSHFGSARLSFNNRGEEWILK